MTGGAALLLRGLLWRRGTTVVLLVASALTVAAAAAGPVWGRAAEQSLLTRALSDAPASRTAVVAEATGNSRSNRLATVPVVTAQDAAFEALVLPDALDVRFDEPRTTLTTTRRLHVAEAPPPADPVDLGAETERAADSPFGLGPLAWRDGACEHLDLVSGRCPAEVREVMLSGRSAEVLGVGVGDVVRLDELVGEPVPAGGDEPFLLDYVVVGVYDASSVDAEEPFWAGTGLLAFAPAVTLGGEPVPARLDAVLATRDLLAALQTLTVQVEARRMLRPGALPLADVGAVTDDLERFVADTAGPFTPARVHAPLLGLLAETVPGRELVGRSAVLVTAQVVAVGWFVLFGVVAVSVAAREPEVALAKLRGMRTARVAGLALGPPLTVLAAALPLGVLVGLVAVAAARDAVLAPGTPLLVPAQTWWAVGGAVLGAAAAALLATVRSLRVPVSEQLVRSAPPSSSRGAQVAEVVVLTLAVAAVSVVLSTGADAADATLVLVLPVLVGIALGLLGGRLVEVVLRLLAPRSRRWSLPGYLAVRQLGRRAGATRVTALVTATVTFAGFTAASWVVAAEQRGLQARLDVGAATVLTVGPVPPERLVEAVEQVDPAGSFAMAAVQVADPDESGTDRLLAVDSRRLGAVAAPGTLTTLEPDRERFTLAQRNAVPSLDVLGRSWEVDVDLRQLGTRLDLALTAQAVTRDGAPVRVSFGSLAPGPQTVVADVEACAGGCRVSRFTVVRMPGEVGALTGVVSLAAFRVDGTQVDRFGTEQWRSSRLDERSPDSTASAELSDTPAGLVAEFTVGPSGIPGIVRRDVPEALDAVLAVGTGAQGGRTGRVRGSTLGDVPTVLRVLARTPALPRLGDDGALVDLRSVALVAPAHRTGTTAQVWLSGRAPAGVERSLTDAGLQVLGTETVADRRAALDRAGEALALLLLLIAGATVLLAGLAGVATSVAAQSRRRGFETASLRALAVSDRDLRRSARFEHAVLVVPGLLLGAVGAGASVLLTAEVLSSTTGAGRAVAAVPGAATVWVPVLAVTTVTAALVVAVTASAGRAPSRRATADRLREVQA